MGRCVCVGKGGGGGLCQGQTLWGLRDLRQGLGLGLGDQEHVKELGGVSDQLTHPTDPTNPTTTRLPKQVEGKNGVPALLAKVHKGGPGGGVHFFYKFLRVVFCMVASHQVPVTARQGRRMCAAAAHLSVCAWQALLFPGMPAC